MRCLAGLLFTAVTTVQNVVAALDSATNPWDSYILSPESRTVSAESVKAKSGDANVTQDINGFTLSVGAGARVTLDFGVEVGGLVSFGSNTQGQAPQLSLAFTESPSFIRAISDDTGSVATQDYDKALDVTLSPGAGFYTMPKERFRGGFRFLTINANQQVTLFNISCEIGFAPGMTNLRDYSGYFYSPEDETLMKIWYAGAYTVQTNIASQNTGRFLPQVKNGWAYNATLGVGEPILLDGAKRDRAVWPGDTGISAISGYVSLGETGFLAALNAIETLFYYQDSSTGLFPFAGPATGSFRSGSKSDTYHAWSLYAIYQYAIFTGNSTWLDVHWSNITKGLDYIVTALDNSDGLHKQINTNDWARQGGGNYNSALNALDYQSLVSFAYIAVTAPALSEETKRVRASQAQTWSAAAARLKTSYNKLLWDPSASLFRDNETTAGSKLHPQDGNALAVLFNLTTSSSQAASISTALTKNWNSIGPVTPELPDTISPFISGLEVLAHYSAGQPTRALQLIRRTWGYLLSSPLMTGSTLVEGITANGSLYYRSQAGYKYDAAYTSHSHSWSSGPTQALTLNLVGIGITGWKEWKFKPQPGDITSAKAGFETPMGKFDASWTVSTASGGCEGCVNFTAELLTPTGTKGGLQLPWQCETIKVDGQNWTGGGSIEGGVTKVITAEGCK